MLTITYILSFKDLTAYLGFELLPLFSKTFLGVPPPFVYVLGGRGRVTAGFASLRFFEAIKEASPQKN